MMISMTPSNMVVGISARSTNTSPRMHFKVSHWSACVKVPSVTVEVQLKTWHCSAMHELKLVVVNLSHTITQQLLATAVKLSDVYA